MLEKGKELQSKLKDLKLDDIKKELKDLTNIEPIVNIINGNLLNGTKYFVSTKMAAINILEDLKLKLKEL